MPLRSSRRRVYNYRQGRIMNRAISVCVMSLAVLLGLRGQGIRQPKPFPPDIVPATITVTGIGDTSATLSASDLSKLPQQTVKATDHGTPATLEGVLLTDVLAKVDLPLGEKFLSTGASGLDLHGQIRVRGDDAGWQTAPGQRRPISVGSAGGEKARKMGSAGDGVENPKGKLRR